MTIDHITLMDPAVEAQLAESRPEPEPPLRGRGRRQARQAAADEANQNTPIAAFTGQVAQSGSDAPIVTGVAPEPVTPPEEEAGLSRNEKLDVLWDFFVNVGSKITVVGNLAGPSPEGATDTMRCLECGQVFESPNYDVRKRDGLPARCPNPAHGTKLYPAEFVAAG